MIERFTASFLCDSASLREAFSCLASKDSIDKALLSRQQRLEIPGRFVHLPEARALAERVPAAAVNPLFAQTLARICFSKQVQKAYNSLMSIRTHKCTTTSRQKCTRKSGALCLEKLRRVGGKMV